MAMWCVRAGKLGEREDFALDEGYVVAGWHEVGDLSGCDRDAIKDRLRNVSPDASDVKIANHAGQLNAFINRMQKGDYVVLPLKRRGSIAVGRVVGDYEYHPNQDDGSKQLRKVEWIGDPMPRSRFSQATLYTLGSLLTVFKVYKNDADKKILDVVEGKVRATTPDASDAAEQAEEVDVPTDLERLGEDAIRAHMTDRLKGHRLAAVVGALLEAEGYTVEVSEPGADGGVDVLAGHGAMGFESPRLCVQVKSGDGPVDVGTLRELQGVMRTFNAERGLLVSWGGFKRTVEKEARSMFFELRLWDGDKVIEEVTRLYDRLPADIQADIPLKRIWTLVPDDDTAA